MIPTDAMPGTTVPSGSLAVLKSACAVLLATACLLPSSSGQSAAAKDDVPEMLVGEWVPDDVGLIDPALLPRVPVEHAMISDVRDRKGKWVHQHAYLVHHGDSFWAMWSDGPGVPRKGASLETLRGIPPGHDQAGTQVSFATSRNGLDWSRPESLTGPPWKEDYGWIARGFWVLNNELMALASHFHAPGYAGPGLSLEAFVYDRDEGRWKHQGRVLDDTLNNFPPKLLPDGRWMMTRRDQRRQVSIMRGGRPRFDQWEISPMASYGGEGRPEEPYWFFLPEEKTIVGLIRDNGGSKRLLRTFSRDLGGTWTPLEKTNFPDATSKSFVHRTRRGYYVLVSNSNTRKRDPLTLAVSKDGLSYHKLFWLVGGRHVDYPHIIEKDGSLFVAYSGAKQTMEVAKVELDDLERMKMPDSVTRVGEKSRLAGVRGGDWIDLGDEGASLYFKMQMEVPPIGRRVEIAFATSSLQERVTLGIDFQGRLFSNVYGAEERGRILTPGERIELHGHILSHSRLPDHLEAIVVLDGKEIRLVNQSGRSDANLSRVILRGDGIDYPSIRLASDPQLLMEAKPLDFMD